MAAAAAVATGFWLGERSHVAERRASSNAAPPSTAPVAAPVPTTRPATSHAGVTAPAVPAAATTTAAPAPATTAAPPAAATVPSQKEALAALVSRLGTNYAVSPVATAAGQSYVAVDHLAEQPAGGSAAVVDVYQWAGAQWVERGSVALGADGSTGLILPASQDATPITVASLTGAPTPDFVVSTASASSLIDTVVSDQTGTWRAVPFQTPQGMQVGVPSATVASGHIRATFDSCVPDCAQGTVKPVEFAYRNATFVPAG